MARTAALYAPEKPLDERDLAVAHIEDAERQHHDHARQHEQDSGNQPADRAMEQPTEIDGQLLRLRPW